jgi:hypothetical protein
VETPAKLEALQQNSGANQEDIILEIFMPTFLRTYVYAIKQVLWLDRINAFTEKCRNKYAKKRLYLSYALCILRRTYMRLTLLCLTLLERQDTPSLF